MTPEFGESSVPVAVRSLPFCRYAGRERHRGSRRLLAPRASKLPALTGAAKLARRWNERRRCRRAAGAER